MASSSGPKTYLIKILLPAGAAGETLLPAAATAPLIFAPITYVRQVLIGATQTKLVAFFVNTAVFAVSPQTSQVYNVSVTFGSIFTYEPIICNESIL